MEGTTGIVTVDQLAIWSVAIVAIAGLFGLLWRLIMVLRQINDRIEQFWEDWSGKPARPGVPAQPGVMERQARSEARLEDHEERLTKVEGQVGLAQSG